MNVAPALLHLIFLLQLFLFIVPLSQSYGRFLLLIVLFFLTSISLVQKKRYLKWSFSEMYSNGVIFIFYYIISVLLGLFYGYNFSYTAVAISLIVPILYFLFIPENINDRVVFNIILLYAFISMVFSFIELFAWEKIGFISTHVKNSIENTKGASLFDGENIRVFGFFSNAVGNGLQLIVGTIILLERLYVRFRWVNFFIIILFGITIYFTHTRNNYFSLFFSLFIWLLITKSKKLESIKNIWYLSIISYMTIILMAFYLSYIEGKGSFDISSFSGNSSIQSRVISWVIIYKDYFLKDPYSLHIIFGYGLVQLMNGFEPEVTFWFIDNSILMIYLSSGLLGVFLFFSWLKAAVYIVGKNYIKYKSSGSKILLVFILTYFVNGAMNATILNIFFLLPSLILLSKYTRGNIG